MESERTVAAEPISPQTETVTHGFEPEGHGEAEGHVHLSPVSIWPISLAASTTIAAAGLVTLFPVSFIGLVCMALCIYYWVQELRHEPH